jgi:DNA-binding Lrp family transcriptional regulator
VENLREKGVIKGWTASISVSYLEAIPVAIWGRSQTTSIKKILDGLGECDLTRRVVVAGGNYVYVVGQLRKTAELDRYAEFVREKAEILEPTIGIYSLDPRLMPDFTVDGVGKTKQGGARLTPLDLRIISSLSGNARRPVADVARDVGASTKTVRRHLERMLSNGSVELHARQDAPSGGDMLYLMHLNLRSGVDKIGTGRRILAQYPFPDAYIRAFSNMPSFLMWVFWTDKVTAMREVLSRISEDKDILSVVPNFGYLERLYPTWRDNLTAASSDIAKMHILRSKLDHTNLVE